MAGTWYDIERIKDRSGSKIGRLTPISMATCTEGRHEYWFCVCDCGTEKFIKADDLQKGTTTSCGCYQIERVKQSNTTDGLSHTREYQHDARSRYRVKLRCGDLPHNISVAKLRQMAERLGNRCYYCGGAYEEVDHIVPLSRGGKHSVDNLAPSCRNCNRSKTNKLLGSEWIPPRVRDFT